MVGAEPLEVVGEGDEAELGCGFVYSFEIEPSEAFVLFQVPEHRLDLPSFFSFFDPFLAV